MDLWQEIMKMQGAEAKDEIILKKKQEGLFPYGGDPEKEDNVLLIRSRVSRIFYLRKFFDYPISLKPETFINMGFFRTIKAGSGYLFSCIHKRKEKSLEDFYINRFGKPLYEMFFEDYTEKLWGRHPSEISPDWGAQRVKGLSLGKVVLNFFQTLFGKNKVEKETSLIEQFYYPKYGPGQLYEEMAKKILDMGGEIHFQKKVTEILFADESHKKIEKVVAKDLQGVKTEFTGDFYLSSMPVKDLVTAMGSCVPGKINSIARHLPYRDFITVGLLVKKLEIENETKVKTLNNIVPDCWIYIQERDVKIGRLQIFNNWSPYMVEDFENTIFIGLEYFCSEGDELWNKSKEDFIKMAIKELEKIKIVQSENIISSTYTKVKKAYPAYFDSYKDFDKVREWLDGVDNLYCIGRNGQHRYNNMDHSMLTAIEAVNVIKNNSKDKSLIWNVNTEEEYHEEA